MSQLGQPPKDTVSLTLRDDTGQTVNLSKVAMREENRWNIWQARNPDIATNARQASGISKDVATDYPKLAPFSDITWDENELPLVSIDNELYRLVSIDAISLKRIAAFAQRTYDDWWQKRVAEDLVGVLSEMGSPLGEQVTLQVVDLATEERLLLESDMTHAKRQAVWTARQERGD